MQNILMQQFCETLPTISTFYRESSNTIWLFDFSKKKAMMATIIEQLAYLVLNPVDSSTPLQNNGCEQASSMFKISPGDRKHCMKSTFTFTGDMNYTYNKICEVREFTTGGQPLTTLEFTVTMNNLNKS